jgi:hypothetical protein
MQLARRGEWALLAMSMQLLAFCICLVTKSIAAMIVV